MVISRSYKQKRGTFIPLRKRAGSRTPGSPWSCSVSCQSKYTTLLYQNYFQGLRMNCHFLWKYSNMNCKNIFCRVIAPECPTDRPPDRPTTRPTARPPARPYKIYFEDMLRISRITKILYTFVFRYKFSLHS